MSTLKAINKATGESFKVDMSKLSATRTRSLYVRKGKINGTLFLSQVGNGANAGDICRIEYDAEVTVNSNLFNRLFIYAKKAEAVILAN